MLPLPPLVIMPPSPAPPAPSGVAILARTVSSKSCSATERRLLWAGGGAGGRVCDGAPRAARRAHRHGRRRRDRKGSLDHGQVGSLEALSARE
eukprot:320849-Pyramimonas_sp.AAC.1